MSENMSRPLFTWVYVIVCTVAVVLAGWIYCSRSKTTVLLVRHAERGEAINANLTVQGLERAQDLVAVAAEAGVSAIYATEFCRTAQTAAPLAEELGLTIQIQATYPQGLENCNPAVPAELYAFLSPQVDTPAELTDHIMESEKGGVVLVVGHSDTVPPLVDLLGKGSFGPVTLVGAYDRLFIVARQRYSSGPHLIKARYGKFSCYGGVQATCP